MTTLRLRLTDKNDAAFLSLVTQLNADLAIRDGEDHAFYNQFNSVDKIDVAVVAEAEGLPVACGALRRYDDVSTEVKRMFTRPEWRGKGIALQVLEILESEARRMGFARCILETGLAQPEAIALYKKAGYRVIPNYGPYEGVANSVCFARELS